MTPLFFIKIVVSSGVTPTHFQQNFGFEWTLAHSKTEKTWKRVGPCPLETTKKLERVGLRSLYWPTHWLCSPTSPTRSQQTRNFEWNAGDRRRWPVRPRHRPPSNDLTARQLNLFYSRILLRVIGVTAIARWRGISLLCIFSYISSKKTWHLCRSHDNIYAV